MNHDMGQPGHLTVVVLVGVVVALLASLALAAGLAAPSGPAASDINTTSGSQPLLVDNDRTDCPEAGFQTIQAAVDHASEGDTIRVCEGTYTEAVSVSTANLTIYADGPATIESPGWVVQLNASGVTIRGFNINAVSGQGGIRVNANDSLILNNVVHGAEAAGIRVRVNKHAVIRNNTIDNAPSSGYPPSGVIINGSASVVRNTIMHARAGVFIQGTATVRENNISQTESGVDIANGANVTVIGNTLTQNYHAGVLISSLTRYDLGPGAGRIVENRIVNNRDGIIIGTAVDPGPYEFHRNVIMNNANLGIHNGNVNVDDGKWPIVNATNNYWGCGGPSGGLRDPYTNRTANGTGDPISAGDKSGVSNVHFDPFYVPPDVSCPNQTSNPTPSPTATPTPTPTPTPPPADSDRGGEGADTGGDGGTGGEEAGGDEGADSGEGSGDDEGSGDATGGETEIGGTQTTPTHSSPTATPTATETPSPTDSATPTPVVEPGFGIGTWLVGFVLAAGILARRRRGVHHD